MSGETEKDVSGWTTDTLNSLIQKLLAERDERYADRFMAAHRDTMHVRKIIETRINGMDRANEVLAGTVNRVPTDVDRQVGQLKAVHDERFKSVDAGVVDLAASMVVRFQERDTRSEREARDNKIAVDAAFAAAKEAVAENNKSSALANDKSEASFTKQIDALGSAVDSKFRATDGQVDDLKEAMGKLTTQQSTLAQTVASTTTQRRDEQSQSNWSTGVIVSSIFGILGLIVSIVVAIVLIVHG